MIEMKKTINSLDHFVEDLKNLKNNLEFIFEDLIRFNDQDDSAFGKLEKFKKIIFFKIDNLIEWFLDIEQEILESTLDDYYETLFEKKYETERVSYQVTRLVDSFLTQYFSLFDIFISFIIRYKFPENDANIDSVGSLFYFLKDKNKNEDVISIFQPLLDNKKFINKVKHYRDYLVHQNYLRIESITEPINEQGYSLKSFYIHDLDKIGHREYKRNPLLQYKINILIRQILGIQLHIFVNILEILRLEHYIDENLE